VRVCACFDAFITIQSGRASVRGGNLKLLRKEGLTGFRKVSNHGFAALANAMGPSVTEESLGDLFDRMDEYGDGTVQLNEWCNYLTNAEVAGGTLMGSLISGDDVGRPEDKSDDIVDNASVLVDAIKSRQSSHSQAPRPRDGSTISIMITRTTVDASTPDESRQSPPSQAPRGVDQPGCCCPA
jgi:hypothetical protein